MNNSKISLIHFMLFFICFGAWSKGNATRLTQEETNKEPKNHTQTHDAILVTTSAELRSAIKAARAGDSIVVAAETYVVNNRMDIFTSGTSENKIVLTTKEGARAKLDFSAMTENSSNQGILLTADFWHIKGLDVFNAGDNGMKILGNENVIEFCTFSECSDTGLQLSAGAANNTILNCDSFYNADSSIENADGFAAKIDVGSGNKFIGCRAWQNLDDGWDGYLRGTDNVTTTYKNCWAIKNGYLKDGTVGGGDGNGFKTGGSDGKTLKHNAVYTNCLTVENTVDGFDHNSNRGTVTIYNATAYKNGTNYHFTNTNALEKLIIKNCIALEEAGRFEASEIDISNNSWMNGFNAAETDFESLDVAELLNPRNADGSLPDVNFMHLTTGSDLIDAGTDVNLKFNGNAPDLGAFENQN